ncbi:MAG: dihydropteroate synthase [Chitinophagaceae bacterium]
MYSCSEFVIIILSSYLMFKNNQIPVHSSIACNGKLLLLNKPVVMGILNCTTDSFFSQKTTFDSRLSRTKVMIEEGASIIDIGGMSSKPGAHEYSEKEELNNVLPYVEAIKHEFPNCILSIDTYRSTVAKACLALGANIINDISGGEADNNMYEVVAQYDAAYICMHMKGTPQNMQLNPLYENVTLEILDYFNAKTKKIKEAGIQNIILDVGFGFGKTILHNYTLLQQMHAFRILGFPLLAGISRKSMIYKALHATPENALNGTTFLHAFALQQGACILRVHDVKEAHECITLFNQFPEEYPLQIHQ